MRKDFFFSSSYEARGCTLLRVRGSVVHVEGETLGVGRHQWGFLCEEATREGQLALKLSQPLQMAAERPRPTWLRRPFSQNGERGGRGRPSEVSSAPGDSESQLATRKAGTREARGGGCRCPGNHRRERRRSRPGRDRGAAGLSLPERSLPGERETGGESAPVESGAGQVHELQSRSRFRASC